MVIESASNGASSAASSSANSISDDKGKGKQIAPQAQAVQSINHRRPNETVVNSAEIENVSRRFSLRTSDSGYASFAGSSRAPNSQALQISHVNPHQTPNAATASPAQTQNNDEIPLLDARQKAALETQIDRVLQETGNPITHSECRAKLDVRLIKAFLTDIRRILRNDLDTVQNAYPKEGLFPGDPDPKLAKSDKNALRRLILVTPQLKESKYVEMDYQIKALDLAHVIYGKIGISKKENIRFGLAVTAALLVAGPPSDHRPEAAGANKRHELLGRVHSHDFLTQAQYATQYVFLPWARLANPMTSIEKFAATALTFGTFNIGALAIGAAKAVGVTGKQMLRRDKTSSHGLDFLNLIVACAAEPLDGKLLDQCLDIVKLDAERSGRISALLDMLVEKADTPFDEKLFEQCAEVIKADGCSPRGLALLQKLDYNGCDSDKRKVNRELTGMGMKFLEIPCPATNLKD